MKAKQREVGTMRIERIERKEYLEKLIAFRDKQVIKITI